MRRSFGCATSSPSTGSRPISELRFLSSGGDPIDAPSEWSEALLDLGEWIDAWPHLSVTANRNPLELAKRLIGGDERLVASWPRSGPGRHRVSVTTPEASTEATATIRPSKISQVGFEAMLLDLDHRLPTSIAIGLQRGGALAGTTFRTAQGSTVAEELSRLETAVFGSAGRQGLIDSLRQLGADPHRMLLSEERWTHRDRARRPTPHRIPTALAVAGNYDRAIDRPYRVFDAVVRHTVDVYENRLVKAFATIVQRRARRLERIAPEGEAHHRSQLLGERLAATVAAATFLADVSDDTPLSDRPTMVLQKRPPYRAAYEGWIEFRRSRTVNLELEAMERPLDNLPYLYEVWCTLVVLQQLIDASVDEGFIVRQQRVVHPQAASVVVRVLGGSGPVVRLEHPDGRRIEAYVQESFGRKSSGLRSISFTQQPDITIHRMNPDGRRRITVYDPKYKLDSSDDPDSDGRPKKADIDKMHAYRDAIRSSDGDHVVDFAAILYPGATEGFGDVAAIRAVPESLAQGGNGPEVLLELR